MVIIKYSKIKKQVPSAIKKLKIKKLVPAAATSYQIGAILKDSWGGEQTNIDFYCIIRRKNTYVTLLPMTKKITKTSDNMVNTVIPLAIIPGAQPIRKKIKVWDNQEQGFTFRNYTGGGWCRLWNGKPVTETHYA